MKYRKLPTIALAAIVLSTSAYAADGHDHGSENGTTPVAVESHQDGHGHDDGAHFSIEKPDTVDEAWRMIDDTIKMTHQAIKDKNMNVLHEAGERLVSAVSALHDHPQAIKEENGQKLSQALDQLSKTVDRFHHATEDKNNAAIIELIDLFQSQVTLVKSLYPSVESVEP